MKFAVASLQPGAKPIILQHKLLRNPEPITMTSKSPKSIDLGALQDSYVAASKQYLADAKALIRAQDYAGASKLRMTETREALDAATRAILA